MDKIYTGNHFPDTFESGSNRKLKPRSANVEYKTLLFLQELQSNDIFRLSDRRCPFEEYHRL